jgi:hypothetical protein
MFQQKVAPHYKMLKNLENDVISRLLSNYFLFVTIYYSNQISNQYLVQ